MALPPSEFDKIFGSLFDNYEKISHVKIPIFLNVLSASFQMSNLKEEFEALMDEINNTNFRPDETGYLLSAKFIDDFRDSTKTNFPPDPIDNNDIKRKGKLKPNMKQNKDYFVVSKDTWDRLISEYEGGPEVTCAFDILGNANIYPITLTFAYRGTPMSITTTRALSFDTLLAQIRANFDIPEAHIVRIFAQNNKNPIDTTAPTIEILSNYANKFEIQVEIPKPPKEPKIHQPKQNPQKDQKNQEQKIVGLKNLGNSCYMNASIQSFLSLPHFTSKIESFIKGELSLNFQTLYKNILKSKSAYDPKLFKQAFGHKIPFFANTSQQDAHEFTSFFIDILHEENNEIITPLFYGTDEATTTCAICQNKTSVLEKFSSLSLPISASRRIIFSPWNLEEPMQRLSVVPETPVILYGRTRTGQRLAQAFTAEFIEAIALEAPSCFDEEENEGLAIVKLFSGQRSLCKPILVRVPLGVEVSTDDLEISVWNRIEPLFDSKNRKQAAKAFKIKEAPQRFTKSKENQFAVNEEIIVEIAAPYGDRQYGFLDHRIRTISTVISLEELVQAYFSEIQLDTQNKWRCEKCGDESCAFHKVQLIDLPLNLVIQLKRFASGNKFERDNSPVSIPHKIDLSRYFKDNGVKAEYSLRAISNHIGNLDAGHYTALGKRGQMWYLFNDNRVMQKDPPAGESEAPYILFYSREVEQQQ
ncbi:hypothetical protein TRFO_03410 [Tritrichomonas foetus]|uniref:Ubiquitin carboxyl-terminal hydrolase n=1 Tax=Tritrichomonas foetus TaxID=1144522 RepID=A0A1J4KP50_9EUKA|nr:hypothetical protein TRFO_03410 [Tritrichomonas foetus]|eukprot:OHT13011.1 hypothetical protein TRFO_03410 [Tritrichomonas foetus]